MTWEFLSIAHIASLVLAATIIFALYFALKNKTEKTQIWTLGVLSLSGVIAIIYNLVAWNSPLEYLPLHLCSLNALVLPFAVFTRNKHLNNLLLLWSIGALLAIVVNHTMAHINVFSWTFVMFFFPHVLEFGIPVLMFALGLVKKDVKCIKWTIVITMVSYTFIHWINIALNAYLCNNNVVDYAGRLIQVNYMFSIIPDNPIFALFYQLVPYEYWYMYMAIPIMIVYLGIVYAKEIKDEIGVRIVKETANHTHNSF